MPTKKQPAKKLGRPPKPKPPEEPAKPKKPQVPVNKHTPEQAAAAAQRQRDMANANRRKAFDALADIGDLPAVVDPKRKKRCESDLLLFLETYFPYSTGLSPLGPDQVAAVRRIQVAIEEEGWVANIMPRGFIKSTMSENAILWAILYGKRKYPMFFAGTADLAKKGIASIKQELVTNELLMEDFPEACYPMVKLEGKAMRQFSQTYKGELTNIIYSTDVIRLANIPGAPCAGAIVESYGLLAPPRGARYKDEQGRNVRPDLAVLDDPQTGDPLDVTTPILTSDGWKTMGTIQVGDKVFDETGRLCNVVATSPVFENRDCYKLLFDNSGEITACGAHKWVTQSQCQRTNSRRRVTTTQTRFGKQYERKELASVRTTQEIFDTQHCYEKNNRIRSNHSIDLPATIDFPESEQSLDPYLLGYWLGNGTSRLGAVTVSDADVEQIITRYAQQGYEVVSSYRGTYAVTGDSRKAVTVRFSGLKADLERLGVLNNKHIPDRYLFASEDQRLSLLRGLMDSDGSADLRGRCQLTNTNKAIVDGVLFLLRSLGLKPTVRKCKPAKKTKKQCWSVNFTVTNFRVVFELSRKQSRVKYGEKPSLQKAFIEKVERVESVPVRCISVDSESHLFLAGACLVPTHNSARSATQCDSRKNYIKAGISMMGAHGAELAMILNATVIVNGDLVDQIADPDISPEWQSVRVKMVKKMPVALETHWLGEYARIRRSYDRNDPRGRVKAKELSTEYLRKHYDVMHEGSQCAWDNIRLERTEISALQHAMNIYIDKGPEVFMAECQNMPMKSVSVTGEEITRDSAYRFSGYERYVIPNAAHNLVAQIDVHDSILYYCVAAVQNDFTGFVVDYGTFPEQNTPIFTMRTAKQTLSKHYRLSESKTDTERAISLGIEDLIHQLLGGNWKTANGDIVPFKCICVDTGYKQAEVTNAIRRAKSQIVLKSRGLGIGPRKKPMSEYDLSPDKVIKYGPDRTNVRWLLPSDARDGIIYEVQFDTNFWKSVMLARMTQASPVARWQLYSGGDHGFFINHCMSETPVLEIADGRSVNVWGGDHHALENHWWDCLVGTGLAASLCGCYLPVSDGAVQVETPAPIYIPPKSNLELLKTEDGRDFFYTIGRD